MTSRDGLDEAEVFVLAEIEPEALLFELPALWTDNGTDAQRAAAVPVLRDAVVSLARQGLIEVHDFPAWPTMPDQAIPVPAEALPAALADVQVWLWHGQDSRLLTTSITESGMAWLSRQS